MKLNYRAKKPSAMNPTAAVRSTGTHVATLLAMVSTTLITHKMTAMRKQTSAKSGLDMMAVSMGSMIGDRS